VNQSIPYDLIAKHLAGEASTEEAAQIALWRSASAENEQEFLALEKVWKQAPNVAFTVDVEAAWQKVKAATVAQEKPEISMKPWYQSWVLQAAAMVTVLLATWWLLQSNEGDYIAAQTQDATQQIELVDGSIITLNAQSELKYSTSFGKENRDVILTGEAYFAIHRDEAHPFVIHAEGAGIKVLGTAFNVKALAGSNEVRIDVTHGKVLFFSENASADSIAMILVEGESAILDKKTHQITKIEETSNEHLFWKSKTLIFKKARLDDVVMLLNDLYSANISLENPNIKDCFVSTTFEDQPLQNILNIISATLNLEVKKEANKIVLSGAGC